MASQKAVTPVKTGVQGIRNDLKTLDSGLRRNDERIAFFCVRRSLILFGGPRLPVGGRSPFL